MRRTILSFFLVLFLYRAVQAGGTLHQKMVWLGYYNTLSVGKHWLIHNEIENRQFVGPSAENLLALRAYARYKIGKHIDVGGGFFYYLAGTQVPEKPTRLLTPELRPMVEVNNYFTWGRFTLHQRLRSEQRFIHKTANNALADGYTFTLRLRYRLGLDVTLFSNKETDHTLKLRISDEIMVHWGKPVAYVYDQNRLSVSLLYQPPWPIGIEAGYLWWYQQRPTGDFISRQVFRIALLHRISLPALRAGR